MPAPPRVPHGRGASTTRIGRGAGSPAALVQTGLRASGRGTASAGALAQARPRLVGTSGRPAPGRASSAPRTSGVDPVKDDLEDYFERLDRQRLEAQQGGAGAVLLEAPSVARFSPQDFARLHVVRTSAGDPGAECAICLLALRTEAWAVALPCAPAHCFHTSCVRSWLSKSVHCPLCRVDVLALLPAQPQSSVEGRLRVPSSLAAPAERRTRGGGRVLAYLPEPPSSWARPAYIPAHLRHLAEYLEISYPGRGTAKIWRVPNLAVADLSNALPLEEG